MAIRAEDLASSVDIDRDRVLVLRHQGGDAAAFDELYRRYHDRLVGYCERRVGDRHAAEELAQEAFLRALRAMPRFAGERRFYPWMTVIAQRLCIDHHRKAARVEPTADVDGGWVEADHEALWAQVDRLHLSEALARLAPRHREILDLREARGWSYQQIADHLDVPLTTVEALLHRARKALRREFAKAGGEERAAFGAVPALAGVGLLARLKGWAAALGPDRFVPALGAAAAGIAAVGVAVGPLAPAGPTDVVQAEAPATAPAPPVEAPPLPVEPVATTAPVPATTTPPPPPTVATATAPEAPPTTVDLGVAVVFVGPEGSRAAEAEGQALPWSGELGDLGIGVDPTDLVTDATELVTVLLEGLLP